MNSSHAKAVSRCGPLIVLAGVLLLPHAHAVCPDRANRLSAMRDCYRVLLVFAPGPHDPQYRQQLQQFRTDTASFRERDLLLVPVFERHSPQTSGLDREGPPMSLLSAEEDAVARRRFDVAGAFAAVLLGKDGGEKLRSDRPIAAAKLFSTIDSMPMRQREMKYRGREPR